MKCFIFNGFELVVDAFLVIFNCLKIYERLILLVFLELNFELDLGDFDELCMSFEKFKLSCEWN